MQLAMITKLKKNDVFVFGSNLNGAHVGGAALQAFKKFGAEPTSENESAAGAAALEKLTTSLNEWFVERVKTLEEIV